MKRGVKLLNVLRRRLAALVALTLVVTMTLPYAGNIGLHLVSADTAYAAGTEMTDESATLLQEDSSGNTTMFHWGNSTRGWDSDERGYNVLGINGKTNKDQTFFEGFNTVVYGNGGGEPPLSGFTMEVSINNTNNPINDTAQYNSTNIGAGAENEKMKNGFVRVVENTDDSSKKAEVKVVTSVSPDKRYVFMDVYGQNLESENQLFSFRCREDSSVGSGVQSRVLINPNDDFIHLADDNTSGCTFRTKDIIMADSVYELDPLNVTYYCDWNSRNSTGKIWGQRTTHPWDNLDPYLIFGWKNVLMRPYERIHKRLAIMVRPTTYYVHSDLGKDTTTRSDWTNMADEEIAAKGYPDDSEWKKNTAGYPGSFDKPFQTIQYAINRLGNTKGFICIQNDCDMNEVVNVQDGADITFMSADVDIRGRQSLVAHTLKVAQSAYFNMTGGNITF